MAAFALLIVCFIIIFSRSRKPSVKPAELAYATEVAKPLCSRLSSWRWTREDIATIGLRLPAVRIFWAEQLGWIEYRKRIFRPGMWIRLTPAGAQLA